MNYPYPIPGYTTTPVVTGPYFAVGNECCNGGMTNDIDAITKVVLDYTNQLPAGVTVTSIAYEVTPPSDQMLLLISKVLTSPIASFMVSGGAVGQSYSVEALATLSDGQHWVDHITVSVTDCDAMTANVSLLSGLGPIAITNTLYYNATANQVIFPLAVPDEFGRVGTLVDSNVMVYVNGLRKEPVDDYTVSVRANSITFMSPLVVGTEVTFDLLTPPPLPPVWPAPVLITGGLIATSLYYLATNGQTSFHLGVPDRFNHIGSISTATGNALVYVNGARKEPADDYTINVGANTITFTSPLPLYAEVDFDLVTSPPPQPVTPPPVVLTGGVVTNTLYYVAISGQSVFPLGVPDEFNNVATLTLGAHIYRSGNRLVPTDGYTLDVPNNQVILAYPAGDGEPVAIELTTVPPAPVLVDIAIKSEALDITTDNVIPALVYPPNGVLTTLYVNGLAFFSIGSQAAFTVSGNVLTWTSTVFSLPAGAAVVAVYTYG
jgi:hypothetical protein